MLKSYKNKDGQFIANCPSFCILIKLFDRTENVIAEEESDGSDDVADTYEEVFGEAVCSEILEEPETCLGEEL